LLFNAGCNEQVFCSKILKKNSANPSCCFREKRKTHTLIPKKDVTEPKARLLIVNYYLLDNVTVFRRIVMIDYMRLFWSAGCVKYDCSIFYLEAPHE